MNPINPFSKLPEDMQRHILSFINPMDERYVSARTVKQSAARIYALITKESRITTTEKIQELKKPYLAAKYSTYESSHEALVNWYKSLQENPSRLDNPFFGHVDREFLARFNPSAKPHLLDALFTGCNLPFAEHSQSKYTEEVENDIKEIVQLMPESLNYGFGCLRLRANVPPLGAAIVNNNIPISLIEWLFQNGANPNATWGCENNPRENIRIINCLKNDYIWFSELSSHRRQSLIEIFERYGAVEEDLSSRRW